MSLGVDHRPQARLERSAGIWNYSGNSAHGGFRRNLRDSKWNADDTGRADSRRSFWLLSAMIRRIRVIRVLLTR